MHQMQHIFDNVHKHLWFWKRTVEIQLHKHAGGQIVSRCNRNSHNRVHRFSPLSSDFPFA